MRLEITRRADLAVRALALLTSRDRRWKAPEVAEALATTTGFATQALGPLVKAGWVQSIPGPHGGYSAAVEAGEVSVLDVIESVDGATDAGRCVVADRACNAGEPCLLHVAWGQARAELTRSLGATPVSALNRYAS
jgi:Rrf2 family transcriptional regulator, iron-sulfur cluster assembly transcription factor